MDAGIPLPGLQVEIIFLASDHDPAVHHAALAVKVVLASVLLQKARHRLPHPLAGRAHVVDLVSPLHPSELHLVGISLEVVIIAFDLFQAFFEPALRVRIVADVSLGLDDAAAREDPLRGEVVCIPADAVHASRKELSVLLRVVGLLSGLKEAAVIDPAISLSEVVQRSAGGRDLSPLLITCVDCAALRIHQNGPAALQAHFRVRILLQRRCAVQRQRFLRRAGADARKCAKKERCGQRTCDLHSMVPEPGVILNLHTLFLPRHPYRVVVSTTVVHPCALMLRRQGARRRVQP